MDNKTPTLAIVVPCYNEEEVLSDTCKILFEARNNLIAKNLINSYSTVVLVDDGSSDRTWIQIKEAKARYPEIRGIRLSKNGGHQTALIAGLEAAYQYAEVMITIDADLQDDVAAMEPMLEAFSKGSDIVYGVRSKRDVDTIFKRTSAHFFYKLMSILGVSIIYNHADYRLTSKRVVGNLKLYTEKNLFLRGIFPQMGFPSSTVFYERKKRTAGTSKYPFLKMLGFALDGITSFSIQPLRLVMLLGLVILILSLGVSAYAIYARYYLSVVTGWSSLIVSIYFLGGLQLFSIGLIGEYLGKVYREVKDRPRYLIEDHV